MYFDDAICRYAICEYTIYVLEIQEMRQLARVMNILFTYQQLAFSIHLIILNKVFRYPRYFPRLLSLSLKFYF